jgi:hypothetical protein
MVARANAVACLASAFFAALAALFYSIVALHASFLPPFVLFRPLTSLQSLLTDIELLWGVASSFLVFLNGH